MTSFESEPVEIPLVETIGEGRFELVKLIAEGGQAQVWHAKENAEPKRDLAVKLFTCSSAELENKNQQPKDIFSNEARTWHLFTRSASVVQLYFSLVQRIVISNVEHYAFAFAMEYSSHGDLNKSLQKVRNSFRSKKQVRDFLLDIACALKLGHDRDVIHGDVKAKNIIVFGEGETFQPKLMDFGMSISTSAERKIWGGTPEYMAPEIFDKSMPSKFSDVYSLGILFFQIVTGQLPFISDVVDKQSRMKEYAKMHNLARINYSLAESELDEGFVSLLKEMLAPNPSARATLSRVVSYLRAQQELDIRTTAYNPDRESILFPGRYRWNPEVHRILGSNLYYFLVKGVAPFADPKWFKNNLAERGIHGYSCYRVLGGYDYLFRIWLKHPYEEEAESVMRAFRDAHGGEYIKFSVKNIDLFEEPLMSPIQDHDRLIEKIYECAHSKDEKEFENLFSSKLILSRLKPEGGAAQQGIRFFVTLKGGSELKRAQKKYYSHNFGHGMRAHPLARQTSIYYGDGNFDFLLKFRVKNFQDFEKLHKSLLNIVNEVRLTDAPLSTQTYVEFDPESAVESDDGSIIAEVNQYSSLVNS